MLFSETTATRKVFGLRNRIRAVAGGTSASKTVSILVWCIRYAQQDNHRDQLISIVSESYPHLQKGAMLDFKNIMQGHGYWKEDNWHDTKHVYTFPETNVKIEFLAIDTYGKAHGPRRDVLFINEANNLPYGIVDQLITRTRKIVWLDWNPSEEFWFYTEMKASRDDIDFITLTYKDNEALDAVTIAEIEAHKNNKTWWTVYGLGQLGSIASRIYTNWQIIEEIPHEARLVRRWLDFGYSNDPTAIGDIYRYNGGYILDEQCYQKRMMNDAIAEFIRNLEEPQVLVKGDSAEPKSIDELRSYGVNVLPASKGPGSISQGIRFVQGQRISVTSRSVNLIKEYRNYNFVVDKNGVQTANPEEGFDHHMDGIRYGFEGLGPVEPKFATFGGGDTITGYGGSHTNPVPIASRGYRPRPSSARTFK